MSAIRPSPMRVAASRSRFRNGTFISSPLSGTSCSP
jgi:hypothetical protein